MKKRYNPEIVWLSTTNCLPAIARFTCFAFLEQGMFGRMHKCNRLKSGAALHVLGEALDICLVGQKESSKGLAWSALTSKEDLLYERKYRSFSQCAVDPNTPVSPFTFHWDV